MDPVRAFDLSDMLKYVGGTAGAVTLGAVTATAAAWYVMSQPEATVPSHNLNDQSVKVPGTASSRISPYCKDQELLTRGPENIKTVLDLFQRGARIANGGPCAGFRKNDGPYQWLTYDDVLATAKNVGAGMLKMGLPQSNSTHVGLYMQNRVEYLVSEVACYMNSLAIVSLYDTLPTDSCIYIVNQSEIKMVVCDTLERTRKLLDMHKETPGVRYIVYVEPVTEAEIKDAKTLGIELINFTQMEKLGAENPHAPKPSKEDDLCVICYTSGTTGKPKGALITHRNVLSGTVSIDKHLSFLRIGPGDVMISYLPLAHMYERICELFVYMNGGSIGFYRGDVRKLMEDIAMLKPTLFPSVPRLLNRVYDKVLANVSSSKLKKMLFDYAVSAKLKEVERGIVRNDSIWDKLVFSKVQKSLGGRVRFIVCGSAPLAPEVLNFLRAATGAVVLEGYGQTECSAVCAIQLDGESGAGHVGVPLACNVIKLIDVPDMDYFAKNQEGEICVKGSNIISGYHKMPEKTAEAIDKDGWLHSGDIGKWLPNGALKIIDRKKNMFKLAQGEYIIPEKIENIYMRCPVVAQIFVHGESLKAMLVGVVVLDPDTIQEWASENLNLTNMTLKQLCDNREVNLLILKELTVIGKNAGLHSFEQVKSIRLYMHMFSVENGLLTPTFKAKRHELARHFDKEITQMYTELA